MAARAGCAAAMSGLAAGHGVMSVPPPRGGLGVAQTTPPYYASNAGGSALWFSQGCSIGCPGCTGTSVFGYSSCGSAADPYVMNATIVDPKERTYNVAAEANTPEDWTRTNPWRAPGTAPVYDPCGVAGGGQKPGDPGNGGVPPPGRAVGDAGSLLPPTGAVTQWKPGSTVEVAWAIDANHGGGYQYRLCPRSEPLTEACFARTPLKFDGLHQTLRFFNGTEVRIPATYVKRGTMPKGSTWARNPIPACGTNEGGSRGGQLNCTSPQFPPPVGAASWGPGAYGLWGFGPGACLSGLPGTGCTAEQQTQVELAFEIVDRVHVPIDLPAGDYVLGFRWDCEQTPQVWSSCGDVTLTKHPVPPQPAPPSGLCAPGVEAANPGCAPCCSGICQPCRNCTGGVKAGGCASCYPSGTGSFGYECLKDTGRDCDACWTAPPAPAPAPPGPAPPAPAPAPSPSVCPSSSSGMPACDVCCTGACAECKACVGVPKSYSKCKPCWAAAPGTGTQCMYDDKHGCQACWAGAAPAPPTTPAPPAPAPPAPAPSDSCSEAKCAACCGTGACVACKACIGSKAAPCDKCWAVDPVQGKACLYDDGHGCQSCWAAPAPAPAPPTPPAPAPPAPPTPSACPGGSLTGCIALCPVSPSAVYTACCRDCGHRCA